MDPADPRFTVTHVEDTDWTSWSSSDQRLVATNSRRAGVNTRFRYQLGFAGEPLMRGDRVVVLRNTPQEDLWNGTTATVLSVRDGHDDCLYVELQSDDSDVPRSIDAMLTPVGASAPRGIVPLDYGYALTVHKAQGSEWPRVLTFAEGKTNPTWLYTALTRAEHAATLVLPSR